MRFHLDDRATRYCDVFPKIGKGDINITVLQPGALAAWHRHQNQDDYMLCIQGAVKIGVCNEPRYTQSESELRNNPMAECHFEVLSDRQAYQGPLFIKRGLWHGIYNFTNEPAILVYHITNKYDGEDEERASLEKMGWNWERRVK